MTNTNASFICHIEKCQQIRVPKLTSDPCMVSCCCFVLVFFSLNVLIAAPSAGDADDDTRRSTRLSNSLLTNLTVPKIGPVAGATRNNPEECPRRPRALIDRFAFVLRSNSCHRHKSCQPMLMLVLPPAPYAGFLLFT